MYDAVRVIIPKYIWGCDGLSSTEVAEIVTDINEE